MTLTLLLLLLCEMTVDDALSGIALSQGIKCVAFTLRSVDKVARWHVELRPTSSPDEDPFPRPAVEGHTTWLREIRILDSSAASNSSSFPPVIAEGSSSIWVKLPQLHASLAKTDS